MPRDKAPGDPDRFDHDPVRDESKLYSLSEFTLLVIGELYEHWSLFLDKNEFHGGKHTYLEWFRSFHEWKSW